MKERACVVIQNLNLIIGTLVRRSYNTVVAAYQQFDWLFTETPSDILHIIG